jgi:tRNA pseudouridine55 synthase
MDGVLIVDKPVGPTSHDVVARVRRALREQRIGHTGTLDPAASGVLPLVIGRATRLARFLSASDKRYDAIIRLGWTTDTGDARGAPVGGPYEGVLPGREAIAAALDSFRGAFLQQPPAYSAKKIDGHRSYVLARAKVDVLPAPAPVTVNAIEVAGIDGPHVTVRIDCSAGFYVRSLARDLGDRLGVGAHVATLRRIGSGDYTLSDALALDVIEGDRDRAAAAIIPPARLLQQLAWVVLTPEGAIHARHGRDLVPADLMSRGTPPIAAPAASAVERPVVSAVERPLVTKAEEWVRLLDSGGQLLGLARVTGESGPLHPSVLLM